MLGSLVLTVLLLIILLYGREEMRKLRRSRNSIPIRIHVNGTRGKSSVTRLIAAGLREGGIPTLAKTTGTSPKFIYPDGREVSIARHGSPNIREQIAVLNHARTENVRAIVLECMALQPTIQKISEDKMIQATHTVITNILEDHLEVMGPRKEDVCFAFGGTVPPGKQVFTAERDLLPVLTEICSDRSAQVHSLNQSDLQEVLEEDLCDFRYFEHKENVALALKVCQSVGVPKQTALQGMKKANPDPGATCAYSMQYFGRQVTFVNGFAANDPKSSRKVWDLGIANFSNVDKRIAIINCRSDRSERSIQLGKEISNWKQSMPDLLVLVGESTHILAKALLEGGVSFGRIEIAESATESEVFERILDLGGNKSLVVGLGNIAGIGLSLLRMFRNRSEFIRMKTWIS
ncbi:poly-gamma-glutamate synthase PgsB [Leptospira perolatii]|uniref:Poly-gamma-glutamate synthase PgsB n=1 Tax=Leptospira perolatii TaxID=2023191 RepID=A0A2M9ZQL6_9LEPT|nr:poly-gamma-glutamate synthase PgsB [Leptospira perolatii]PJZ70534.1 poly-gamma-glutamate synthase PgsB [Leptospira perolatii]PJZ74370.1 poly-gamma-glutamate synthase PgsB [Leptospira perolatii]